MLASAHSKTLVQRPKKLIRPGEADSDRIGGNNRRRYTVEQMAEMLRRSNGPDSPYVAIEASSSTL